MRTLLAAWLSIAAGFVSAQPALDAHGWLRKIQQASQKLSFEGTFVSMQGDRSETSRIARLIDAAGELERIEVLDGMPREIIRTRDLVRCYMPEQQTVKIDRPALQRSFPSLFGDHIGRVMENYHVTLGARTRVAGIECQEILLVPKDSLRYGYKLWADQRTGLLLKAVTLDERARPVEQFVFTQVSIGPVSRDKLKSRLAARARDWRIEDSTGVPANLAEHGWSVAEVPGFRRIAELKRRLGDARLVSHVVYSDGIAAVSVFIEPLDTRSGVQTGVSSMGAVSIYTREVANHLVTVVGEAPPAGVQRIGDNVTFRNPGRNASTK